MPQHLACTRDRRHLRRAQAARRGRACSLGFDAADDEPSRSARPRAVGKQARIVYVLGIMRIGKKRDGWALLSSGGLHVVLALLAWRYGQNRPPVATSTKTATRIEIVPRPPSPPPSQATQTPPMDDPQAPSHSPPVVSRHTAPPAPAMAANSALAMAPVTTAAASAPRTARPIPTRLPTKPAEPDSHAEAAERELVRPSPPGSVGHIDLFPSATLCKTIGCSDGRPSDAGQALQAHLAAEQAEREGAEAVRSGRVDPLWRQVERDVEKSFAPPEKSVTSASRGELALRQLSRQVTPAPERTKAGWLLNMAPSRRLMNEIRAAQDAYDEAAVGREAEIEAEIDAQGEVVAVRVVLASGHRQFDAEALRAVRQALRLRPLHDPQGPVIARYALRGEVAVNLPRVNMAVEPNSGITHDPMLSLAGTFDEVTGKAEVRIPFLKRLKKTVRLLSVRKRLP